MVDKPTRNNNINDLIFTNNPAALADCITELIMPVSDHNLVRMKLTCHTFTAYSEQPDETKRNPLSFFNFKEADKAKLQRELIGTNWDYIINPTVPVITLHNRFTEALSKAATRAEVPLYRQYKLQKQDKELSRLVNLRKSQMEIIQNKDTRTTTKLDIQHLIEKTNQQIQEKTYQIRRDEENKAVRSIRLNSKYFYTYAKQHRNIKVQIGPLRDGNNFESGPKKMADLLSNQFQSVYTKPTSPMDAEKIDFQPRNVPPITDITITTQAIKAAMEEINPSSAPGPDDIMAFIYNQYSNELAYPISRLWRLSLDTSHMPEGTILAHITPIFKKGDKSNTENYRPVALTNHLTKIFERVFRKALVNHMETNNLMNESQHGFRTGHSTITQILTYYDSIINMLEQSEQVEAIYLDFAKAFDKVDHNILLVKLDRLGIKGKIHRWISTFLKSRMQQVKVQGRLSNKKWVTSGVPQGSVLGPFLFLVMMIDIDQAACTSTIATFADDTKIWKTVNEPGKDDIQPNLQNLYQWAKANNMQFNEEKFEHIIFSQYPVAHPVSYMTPNALPIEIKESVKDLGIYISNDGRFKKHIINMVKEAQKLSHWILRTFKTRDTHTMRTLLKSIIIPKVEYASPVWAPTDQHSITLIENVQIRFTSRIMEFNEYNHNLKTWLCTTNYWERLKNLKIYSLQRRRERYMLLLIYKMIIGLNPCIGFNYRDIKYSDRRKLFITPICNKRSRKWAQTLRNNTFAVKTTNLYNLLPENMREEEYIHPPTNNQVFQFKVKLDKWFETIPDEPTLHDRHTHAVSNSISDQVAYIRNRR